MTLWPNGQNQLACVFQPSEPSCPLQTWLMVCYNIVRVVTIASGLFHNTGWMYGAGMRSFLWYHTTLVHHSMPKWLEWIVLFCPRPAKLATLAMANCVVFLCKEEAHCFWGVSNHLLDAIQVWEASSCTAHALSYDSMTKWSESIGLCFSVKPAKLSPPDLAYGVLQHSESSHHCFWAIS